MSVPPLSPKLAKMIEDYTLLLTEQKHRPLTADELQRLELWRDVILEAGVSLEGEGQGFRRRAPRAPIALEVAFGSREDAARAYTRDIGTGGVAISTSVPFAVGTRMSLQLKVPGWKEAFSVDGEVAWCREGAVGISFKELPDEKQKLLRQLVTENTSFLDRLKTKVASRKTGVAASMGGRDAVLMRLTDRTLFEAAAEVLLLHGYVVVDDASPGITVGAVVCDMDSISAEATRFPGVPLILVNVSGPDALTGKLTKVRIATFVKRPGTASTVADAVRRVLPRA
jgi:uncharacterized protein (TIGR02266 family)